MKRIRVHRDFVIELCNRLSLPLQALGCCILYFFIEAISRHSLGQAWTYMTGKPLVFLYNAFLIFVTSTVAYLFRRRVLARMAVMIFWLLLGLINGVILLKRVTPFTGPDLKLLTDAKKVMDKYLSPLILVVIIVALVLLLAFQVWLWFKGPKYRGPRNWILDLTIVGGSILLFVGATHLALQKRVLSTYFGNIAFAYTDYGYPYCLAVTIFDTGISQPNGYSQELMEEIADSEGEETTDSELPNIIFLQLESFFDPEQVNFLRISEDPIPNFRRMMQEYSSGYFRVPAIGAGTANTEFETISGMSLRYFGPGEYPYKTILKEKTCESIPYVLKDLGYSTHAIHDNEADFYSRRKVFPMLGFDTFTSQEYMADVTDTTETGWLKDHILTEEILKCLDSTQERDYVYTISVQGHGDYPTEPVLDQPAITVKGAEGREKNNYSWEYYCNEIHEMDAFLKELTDTLAEYPEPVVLVMYGDHLPTMGLETKEVKNRYLFQTQYVIWDNMGLEKEDENLAAYQMGAEVLKRVGIHQGNLVKYHQTRRKSKNYQRDLEVLQYDMLYGEEYIYGGESPYKETDMQMGVEPVELESVTKSSEGVYYISGKNFTAASRLEVNGERIEDTLYLSTTSLIVREIELEEGDSLRVIQQGDNSSKAELSATDILLYETGEAQKDGTISGKDKTDAKGSSPEKSDTDPSETEKSNTEKSNTEKVNTEQKGTDKVSTDKSAVEKGAGN